MKTAISIPDPLFRAAEDAAGEMGVSRSHLFQLALAEYLRRRGHSAITENLDEVYSKPGVVSGLDPALAWMQGASIVRDQGGVRDQDGEDW